MRVTPIKVRRKPRPDTTEIAVAQIADKYSSYPSNGLTPERLAMIFRAADTGDVMRQMELFEEMEEKDPHLFSQLQTRKNAVTGLDYEINAASDDPPDKQVADFVTEAIGELENLEDVFTDLLDAIGKGFAVSEIMWGYDDQGRIIAQDIISRHQKRFFWDTEDVFKCYTRDAPSGIVIPQNKFIVHRYKARSGHTARAGVLRVVAWMYLFKNYDIKDWVAFCEVFGMPLRLGKYAPGASDADKAALMEALIQIGTDAAGMVPDGTSIDFIEAAKVSSNDLYERLARYCDEQMSKAILGQTLTSDSGGGSFAQSKTHNEVRHDLTVADAKALAATLRRDLIKPLVEFNFGTGTPIPTMRFDSAEAEDLQQTAEIYRMLVCDMGVKVPEGHVRKKFNLPEPQSGEELVTPPTSAQSTFPLKDDTALMTLKAVSSATSYQQDIDTLADKATTMAAPMFRQMFEPILKIVDKAESLEELRDLLQSDKEVAVLYGQMDGSALEELLQRAMFLADLQGRMIEYGRDS